MEVASPLSFTTSAGGTKRSLACSPQLMDTPNHGTLSEMEMGDASLQRSTKRRRFHADTSVDSLSNAFSSHSPFFSSSLQANKNMLASTNGQQSSAQSLKRQRAGATSPEENELTRVVEEQQAVIDSLKSEKSNVESSLESLKSDHERLVKENQILRKAVNIQEQRRCQAEDEVKVAQQHRVGAEEKIKNLEQVILSLRYHLQAQQSNVGNDFMGMRPPDVY